MATAVGESILGADGKIKQVVLKLKNLPKGEYEVFFVTAIKIPGKPYLNNEVHTIEGTITHDPNKNKNNFSNSFFTY